MAFTHKSRRIGYDNIANGSATGVERIIAGSGAFGDGTTKEAIDTFGVSADCVNSSFIANRVVELELGGAAGSSDSNSVNDPSSATTPFYTSATSFSSSIGELNTAI